MADQHPFRSHCEHVLARTPDLARQLVEQTQAALRASSADIAMAPDRNLLFQVSEAVQNHKGKLEAAFEQHVQSEVLKEQALYAEKVPASTSHADALNITELTLVDEAQAEREIEISRTVQLIDLSAEWELRELQSFTAILQGEQTLRTHANPFRPAVYARALSEATRNLPLSSGERDMLLRIMGRQLATLLRALYAQACERLRQMGLKPLAYRAVTIPRPQPPGAINITQPGALQSLIGRVAQAGSNPHPTDQAALHMLTRLFKQIDTDEALQPAVKKMISMLAPSVLHVATQDPQLLRSDRHPTWQLINQVAAYASGYSEPGDAGLTGFAEFLSPLVQRLAQDPAPDSRLFDDTLGDVQTFIEQQSHAQLQNTQHAISELEDADHRLTLQPMLRQQVEQQLAQSTIKGSIKAFLLGPWVDVLTQTMTDSSGPHDDANLMLITVDDLIQSLQAPTTMAERDALRLSLPDLIKRLQRGMAVINLPTDQQTAILDKLMGVHSHHLRATPAPVKPKAEPSPAELVRQMKAEMARDETTLPPPRPDLDTNLGSLPTVPMLYGDNAANLGRDSALTQWVDTLRKGMWCKVLMQGQWTTVHLLWISANRQFFMFTSDKLGRLHSMTRSALVRLRTEGLATDLEDRSLMQRAVDSMLLELEGSRM